MRRPAGAVVVGAALASAVVGVCVPEAHGAFPPAADGRIYVESDRGGNPDIWALEPDGSAANLTPDSPAVDISPAVSPDGRRIAFASNRAGDDFDIWVMDADGTNAVNLTAASDAEDTAPTFAPDGKEIAFARGGMISDVWVMGADGSGLRNLTGESGFTDGDPEFSPDGETIVFASKASASNPSHLWRMSAVDGSQKQDLMPGSTLHSDAPALSPDGSLIAFEAASGDVWVANADGSGARNLTQTPSQNDYAPAFSAGGDAVLFMSFDDAGSDFDLVSVPPAGGPPSIHPGSSAADDGAPAPESVFMCSGRRATIVGTLGADRIRGTSGADVVAALGGDDRVVGRGRGDRICGGAGNDRLVGRGGRDRLVGGAGRDRLSGGGGRDVLAGGRGRDRLAGGRGPDRLRGGRGRDTLVGGPGRDRLRGGPGKDRERQ